MKVIIEDLDFNEYYLDLDESQIEFANWLCRNGILYSLDSIDEINWQKPTTDK